MNAKKAKAQVKKLAKKPETPSTKPVPFEVITTDAGHQVVEFHDTGLSSAAYRVTRDPGLYDGYETRPTKKRLKLRRLGLHMLPLKEYVETHLFDDQGAKDLLALAEVEHKKIQTESRDRIDAGTVYFEDVEFMLKENSHVVYQSPYGEAGGVVTNVEHVYGFAEMLRVTVRVISGAQGSPKFIMRVIKVHAYNGLKKFSELPIRLITEEDRKKLHARGELFANYVTGRHLLEYHGTLVRPSWWSREEYRADGRVMIDALTFRKIEPNFFDDRFDEEDGEVAAKVNTEDLWMCEPYLYGFSFTNKKWGELAVTGLRSATFNKDAWGLLVMDEDRKDTMLTLVTQANHGFQDIVANKGGGCVFLLHGPPGVGKAQPLYSKIQTPEGTKTMGDMKVGTVVSTPDGRTGKVLGVFPQGKRPVYELTFADGRKVRADEDHLWKVKSKKLVNARTDRLDWDLLTTKRMYAMHADERRPKFKVPLMRPAENPDVDLPLDPWLTGFLLGDGALTQGITSFSSADQELIDRVKAMLPSELRVEHASGYDYRITRGNVGGKPNAITEATREMGIRKLATEKSIPAQYMNAGLNQRLELVRGLMDTDGEVSKNGTPIFSTSSPQLALDMQQLIWSLGGIARITDRIPKYEYKGEMKEGARAYRVSIRFPKPSALFTLGRKKERCQTYQYEESLGLQIDRIEYVGEEETQCILIDHPDHLYLTDNFVVTHNTLTAEAMAEQLERPLYSVSVGELGTEPKDLEESLHQILELSNVWKAVILLDEADIFLEARDEKDILRNAMVGIFLRLMEYHQGVIFLTTNRVRQFDQAFHSRISVAIQYPEMTSDKRQKVWQNLLTAAGITLDQQHLQELSVVKMNGRQIKNTIRLALSLASKAERKVSFLDLIKMIELTQQFEKDLK